MFKNKVKVKDDDDEDKRRIEKDLAKGRAGKAQSALEGRKLRDKV